MTALVPHIRVVAALIERHGRYLITQQSSTAVMAGLWEFPSCKVESGDTDETALRRELLARVAIEVDIGTAASSRTQSYHGYHLDLVVYRATISSNQEPHPVRIADLRWVKPQELEEYAFPSADQDATDLLLGINLDQGCTQAHSSNPTVHSSEGQRDSSYAVPSPNSP